MEFDVRSFNSQAVPTPRVETDRALLTTFLEMNGPLDIEIGCGVGWHSILYANANPERRLIAIEQTKNKFAKFQSRLGGHSPVATLLPVHADAIAWVTHRLAPESLDRVFILYPNPEPKAENRRWFRMPFMARLLESMKPGGEITLATNEASYFDEALQAASKIWNLELISNRELKASDTPRTHFEKKYLARGEICRNAIFRKPH